MCRHGSSQIYMATCAATKDKSPFALPWNSSSQVADTVRINQLKHMKDKSVEAYINMPLLALVLITTSSTYWHKHIHRLQQFGSKLKLAMASQIESHRAGAKIVNGDAICKKKSLELLEELGLPNGLLPMEDIQEFGYNRTTGFMWLVQGKKKVEHTFKKIKQTVSYAAEVTAFAEKGKLRKITGVKTKELMLWLSVVEVYVPETSPEKVTFKTGTGLSDTFDASAFALGE
ncbi:hypothetical protein ACP4OV_012064 [Aristida adscensionis]